MRGGRATTDLQSSELLRLSSGAPEPPRAGQFSTSSPVAARHLARFGGAKRLVRSLQADGSCRVTKLGKAFLREKFTEYLAHMPVKIRGRRRNGNAYERDFLRPVVLDSLGRQSDSLGELQAHRNVIAAALRKMGDPENGAVVMELSEEVYTDDASQDWGVSKQSTQVVGNRVETQVTLNRPLGVLQDVSFLQGLRDLGERLRAAGRQALRGAPALGAAARRSTLSTPFAPGAGRRRA